MKRLICLIFLILITLSVNLFKSEKIDDFITYFDNVSSIKLIVDDDEKSYLNEVFNGNKKIIEIDNIVELLHVDYEGITLEIIGEMNIKELIKVFDIHISDKYSFENMKVWEGYFEKLILNNMKTIQIVIKNNLTIIGIPAILNSF